MRGVCLAVCHNWIIIINLSVNRVNNYVKFGLWREGVQEWKLQQSYDGHCCVKSVGLLGLLTSWLCFCEVVYYGASKTVILASELSVWVVVCLLCEPLALLPSFPASYLAYVYFILWASMPTSFTTHTRILEADVHFNFLELLFPPRTSLPSMYHSYFVSIRY